VATPTLAQGLNLPAHLAILAGDKRAGAEKGTREDLEAHELLNAAARAGRAGHLANGVVILIPEPIITFRPDRDLSPQLKSKLRSVLPEDDRCVSITDPLEVVLDRVMEGRLVDRDVTYTVNRLAVLAAGDIAGDNFMIRSFGAFRARQRADEASYLAKVAQLWAVAKAMLDDGPDAAVVALASQSGLPLAVLSGLRARLEADSAALPTTIVGWVEWTIDWLVNDVAARDHLLRDIARSINATLGQTAETVLDGASVQSLQPAIEAWLTGVPLNAIERLLGGDPDGATKTQKMLPRTRAFVTTVIPRGLSFIVGIVSRMVEEMELEVLDAAMIKSLSPAVRRGFNTLAKLEFASSRPELISRVEAHAAYAKLTDFDDLDFDDL
jgi:hypothetical protein